MRGTRSVVTGPGLCTNQLPRVLLSCRAVGQGVPVAPVAVPLSA